MKKEFTVYFEVEGRVTESNLIGRGIVLAENKDEALELARQDFDRQEWTEVEIEGVDIMKDAEPCPYMKNWTVSFKMKGKNGTWYGVAGPYARTESSAMNKTIGDLKKGGLYPVDDLSCDA